MLNMKTSPAGRRELTSREARKLKAYKCSAGVWTIGIGHTAAAGPPAPKAGMVITAAEADAIFARDLVPYERAVCRAIKAPVPQAAFDALVSLCFNIGEGAFARSSVVRLLNAGDVEGAADAFRKWNKVKGKAVRGLTTRREAEREQFLSEPFDELEDEAPARPDLESESPNPIVVPPAAPWWDPRTWFSLSRRPEATAKGGLVVAGAGAAGSAGPQTFLEWLGAKSSELNELVSPLITYGNVFRTLAVVLAVVGVLVMLWAPKRA
jgi:lysozyme